ncbi:hypothetical protein T492DRAFT_846359 [Pavlovales sp. CCMP2436]|nr:hypothetical protein T492DRAFT_846359 [Pavlovales sp. CCMP2436]
MRAFRLSAPSPDAPRALIQQYGHNYLRFLQPEERATADQVAPLPEDAGPRTSQRSRYVRSHAAASHLQQGLMQPGVELLFGASVEAARHEAAAAGVTDGNLVPEADAWICEAPPMLGALGLGMSLNTAVAPALLPAAPEGAASALDRWKRGQWPAGMSDGSLAPEADEWVYDAPPVPNTLGVSGSSLATAAGPTLGGAVQRVEASLAWGRAYDPSLLPSKQQPPQQPPRAGDVDFWDDNFDDSRGTARSSIAPTFQRPRAGMRAGMGASSLQSQSTVPAKEPPKRSVCPKRRQTLLTTQCTASGEPRLFGAANATAEEESLEVPVKRQNLTAKIKATAAGLTSAAEATMSLMQLEVIIAHGWESMQAVAVELMLANGTTSFNGGRGGTPPTRISAARLLARPQGRGLMLATLALSETTVAEAANMTEACETARRARALLDDILGGNARSPLLLLANSQPHPNPPSALIVNIHHCPTNITARKFTALTPYLLAAAAQNS